MNIHSCDVYAHKIACRKLLGPSQALIFSYRRVKYVGTDNRSYGQFETARLRALEQIQRHFAMAVQALLLLLESRAAR